MAPPCSIQLHLGARRWSWTWVAAATSSRALRERKVQAVGVDFAFPEADVFAPMHKVPLPDGCADVITSFDALEHLLPEDVDTVIDEIARLASPKARLCMTICPRPSFAKVDGRGLHPTVKPIKWWIDKFSRVADFELQGRFLIGTVKT